MADRKTYIIANWKMHKTIGEALCFVEVLDAALPEPLPGIEVCLAMPATALHPVSSSCSRPFCRFGGQNVYSERSGAFTGELSAEQLLDAGAQFVLIGHSERRYLFDESDLLIHAKLLRALDAGIEPILCIGETLKEKEEGQTDRSLARQLRSALQGLEEKEIRKIVFAYEPVWAIGSGKVLLPEDVETELLFCRELLAHHWSDALAESAPFLYGGSVKPANSKQILEKPSVDGLLIGGASLDPQNLLKMIPGQITRQV